MPWLLVLAAWATALPDTAPPATPGVPRTEWDATLAVLAEADMAVSAGELVELAGPFPRADNGLGWERRGRTGAGAVELLAADLRAGPAEVQLRLRSYDGERQEATGALRIAKGGVSLVAGWWSWRTGFGLLVGAAGRRPGLTADAGVLPSRPGPRGWTGAPEARSLQGVAVQGTTGPWAFGGAVGRSGDGSADRTVVAAAGCGDGRLTATAVIAGEEVTGLGGSGRWETGVWRGAWEVAWRGGSASSLPSAVAAALEWRPGRLLNLGAVGVGSTGPPTTALAAGHELTGPRGGDGWALRGSWLAAPRIRLLALVSDRRRWTGGPGRERRRLFELQGRYRPGGGLEARVRYRGTETATPVWEDDWPWEPPRGGPVARRNSLGLTLVRTTATALVRADLRTLSLAGTGTTGRRSLLGIEGRRKSAHGVELRAGWHEAWGDPVDLVSALAPLPGRLTPRHWGAWRGEVWAGLAGDVRRFRVAAAVHLRRPREALPDVLEYRMEARLRW